MLRMMLTASAKLSASLGWKYPSHSPFLGRIMAPILAVESKPLAPYEAAPDLRVERPRHLAWLEGGDERVGFRLLGRRIEPLCDALRSPRVQSPEGLSASSS
jgi:hypothetical protein